MLCRRLCHGSAADASQTEAIQMAIRTGKRQCRQFPQRKACHAIHRDACFGKRNRRRKICQIQTGLCILRFLQLLRRAGKALRQCTVSEGFCSVEQILYGFVVIIKAFAHTCLLRALTGKNKCYFTHFAAPFSNASASAAISCTISAAGCSFFTMPAICPAIKQPSLVSPSTAALRSAPTPSLSTISAVVSGAYSTFRK